MPPSCRHHWFGRYTKPDRGSRNFRGCRWRPDIKFIPVSCSRSRSLISDVTHPASIALAPSPRARCRPWLTRSPATRLWLFLLFTLSLTQTGRRNEYDATGREVSFYPNAMMLTTDLKAMVFFHDTKLVSVHLDLLHVPKGDSTVINSACDPEFAQFYVRVLCHSAGYRAQLVASSQLKD